MHTNQTNSLPSLRISPDYVNPPYMSREDILVKESDPQGQQPQETPMYGTRVFKMWDPQEFNEYQTLMDSLISWMDLGWADILNKKEEWVAEERSWVVWVEYITRVRVSPSDRTKNLESTHTNIHGSRGKV